MMETKNAVIASTTLGEEHGCFTFTLMLDYGGGTGQAFSSYALSEWDPVERRRVGWKHGITLLCDLMDTVGVECWEDLKGKHIRVRAEHTKVHSIGHFFENKWLNLDGWMGYWKERV